MTEASWRLQRKGSSDKQSIKREKSLIWVNVSANMQWEAISLNSAGDKPDRLNRGFTVKCLLINKYSELSLSEGWLLSTIES